jgi:ribose 5-phosphate isomerase B
MKKHKIGLAADHAGFYMKELVLKMLTKDGHDVKDFGAHSADDVDYPDYAHLLGYAIEKGEYELGFVFCGSGNGINMTINKHQYIRSGLCWTPEIATFARAHNNANVCAIPARFISANEVMAVVKAFLAAEFEGGRHERRVNKIPLPDFTKKQ